MKRFLMALAAVLVFLQIPSCKGKEPDSTALKPSENAPAKAVGTAPERPTEGFIKGRAVSLRVLEKKAEDCMAKGDCPQEILQLCGIKKLMGYVIDEKHSDLILIGETEATSPPLYLEDFVIALKNAWMLYASLQGNTYYYSSPGCSIDPDSRILAELEQLPRQILTASDPQVVQAHLGRWNGVCGRPQSVTVLGVPFDTRFGRVMVEADYFMKRVTDGSATLRVDGLASLAEMTLKIVAADLKKGASISLPAQSINRFWFFPGENRFAEGEGTILLERSPVTLLTEEELLTRRGDRAGTGQPNPLAQRFAEGFTERYDRIAKVKPIYAEVEALFRFVALAKALRYKEGPSRAGLSLDYLLHRYPIRQTPVGRTLPGIARIQDIQERTELPQGYRTTYLWLPSCGGVDIRMDIEGENRNLIFIGEPERLKKMKEEVLKARPTPASLYWDFPTLWRVRLEGRKMESVS